MRFKSNQLFWDTLYVRGSTWNLVSQIVLPFCFDPWRVGTYIWQFYQNGNQKWGLKVTNYSGTPCTCMDCPETWWVKSFCRFALIRDVWEHTFFTRSKVGTSGNQWEHVVTLYLEPLLLLICSFLNSWHLLEFLAIFEIFHHDFEF